MRREVCVAVACTLGVCRTAHADVEVEAARACYDAPSLRARLTAIVAEHAPEGPSELNIEVQAESGDRQTAVVLLVRSERGELLLERRYALSPADCRSSQDLLATVLDRFLIEIPVQRWSRDAAAPSPDAGSRVGHSAESPDVAKPTADAWRSKFGLRLGASLALPPQGAEAVLGPLHSFARGSDSLALGALFRTSLPRELGSGGYRVHSFLGLVGWHAARSGFRYAIEIRGGPLLVSGDSFDRNHKAWLPWFEGAASFGPCLGAHWLGLELAASPLDHAIVTEDRRHSERYARFRFSLNFDVILLGGQQPC